MKVRSFILFILCAILATACAPTRPAGSDLPPLRIEFTDWWSDYTLIVAQQQGLFEKYGVNVDIIYYKDFTNAVPDFTANKIDAGLFGITDTLNTITAADLRVVAVYDDGGPSAVISVPEIETVEGLKGKRIGVSIGTSYEMFVLEMLATAEMTASDVTLLDFRPEEAYKLLGTDLDAFYGWDPYASEALAAGNRELFTNEQLANLYPDLIVFRAEVVEQRPEDIRAFLRAWFEAVEFRAQYPEESNLMIASYLGIPIQDLYVDETLHIMTADDNQALYNKESVADISVYDSATINANFLMRMGVLGEMPDLETVFDGSYLP